MSLLEKIDGIWQSPDPRGEAEKCCETLSLKEREGLAMLATHLESYVAARTIVDGPHGALARGIQDEPSSDDPVNLLLLLMIAMHHSDSLVLLSPELRQGRLDSWAKWTGQSLARVKAACTLGPVNLRPLIEAE